MNKMLNTIKETFGAKKKGNPIEELIRISNSIFKNDDFVIELEDADNPRFVSFHGNKTVYLPQRYSQTNELYDLMSKKLSEEIYPKFIAYHEFGHASQVTCVHNNQQVHIKASSKVENDANYLFNGGSVPSKINNFLKELFKEGFADCYAGLCLYKETGDIEVFKKISEVRATRYDEFKSIEGKYFIHPNFNVKAAENMGHAVAAFVKNGKDIFSIPFTASEVSLERYIERAVIAGCIAAVTTELRTNDAFLSHFRKFAGDFTINAHQVQSILGHSKTTDQVMKDEKIQGVTSFFIELQKRLPDSYAAILPDSGLKKFLEDEVYKRDVAKNLELADVVTIPYSAGLEKVKVKMVEMRTSIHTTKNIINTPKL